MKIEIIDELDKEEKEILDKLTSLYKNERESKLIRETVVNKIAATDFNRLSNVRYGYSGRFWGGAIILTIALVVSTLLIFPGLISDNQTQQQVNEKKINNIPVLNPENKTGITAPMPDTFIDQQNAVSAELSDSQNIKRKSGSHKQKRTAIAGEKYVPPKK